MRKLTAKQEMFAQAVVLNSGDKVKALKIAGYAWKNYSKNSLGVQADKIFHKPNVNLRIQELQEIKIEVANNEFKIDAKWLLEELKGVRDMDFRDIMTDDLKAFRPLSEWPDIWGREISGVDLMTLSRGEDNILSIIKKIKWPDKTKNRELIGKHIDVQAFNEKISATHIIINDDGSNEW